MVADFISTQESWRDTFKSHPNHNLPASKCFPVSCPSSPSPYFLDSLEESSESDTKLPQQTRLSQATARSRELKPGLPGGWQRLKYLSHDPLSPGVSISRGRCNGKPSGDITDAWIWAPRWSGGIFIAVLYAAPRPASQPPAGPEDS